MNEQAQDTLDRGKGSLPPQSWGVSGGITKLFLLSGFS